MKRRGWLAVAVLLAAPAQASAQVDVEGEGVKVSEGTMLKPKAGVDMGFVSNVFFEEDAAPDGGPKSSAILRVFGELGWGSVPPDGRGDQAEVASDGSTETAGEESVAFAFLGAFRYDTYLSSNDDISEQSDLAARLAARLEILPRSTVSFYASDSFERDTRPTNFESAGNLNRDINKLTLEMRYRPQGRTIQGKLGYTNTLDWFENDAIDFADRIQHSINLRVDWRYLPITVFWFEASQGIYGPLGDSSTAGDPNYKVSSYPLRVLIGGSSAFTPMTTLQLYLGWGAGFYEEGASYSTFLFSTQFGYRYSPLGRIVAVASRDFRDSVNSNFYGEWKFGLNLEQQVGPVVAKAGGGLRLRRYEGLSSAVADDTTAPRDDTIFYANLGAYYYYRHWIAVAAEYDIASVSTDFRQIGGDDPSYLRQVVTLGVHAAY